MNLKTVLRWSFAFFCAALCYFSALTWLSGQGFTAVLHYDKEKSQPFASYDAWQDELKEEPVEEIVATAAWASGGRGSLSTELKSAMVDIFYAKGNAALILPVNMLSGHMPMDDYYSVALDSVSAYALYGAEDIVGRQVEMNDREYTVCGVFEAPVGIFAWGNSSGRGMAFLTPAQEQKIMSVGLLLDDSPEETVQRANNLGMMMGGSDYTENRRLLADFMRQFGLLPLWVWAISALIPMALGVFRFLRRGPKYDPLTSSPGQRFLDLHQILLPLAIRQQNVPERLTVAHLLVLDKGIEHIRVVVEHGQRLVFQKRTNLHAVRDGIRQQLRKRFLRLRVTQFLYIKVVLTRL